MIEAEKANYPIAWMCGLLKVPRASFYEWRGRVVTATAARRGELAVLVGEAFEEFRQAYGCRRIARVLNARGHACSVGLVADLMREVGLGPCSRARTGTGPCTGPVTSTRPT